MERKIKLKFQGIAIFPGSLSLRLFLILSFISPGFLWSNFYPIDYLQEKQYIVKVSSEQQEHYKKYFEVEVKPFSKLFKVKNFTYFFSHEAVMGKKGILISSEDGKFFKKVVEFYERKYLEKHPELKRNTPKKQAGPPDNLGRSDNIGAKVSKEIKTVNPPKKTDRPNKHASKVAVLEPTLSPRSSTPRSGKIDYVFIDAGHGGKDPGAVYYGFKEKNIALTVATELHQVMNEKLGNRKTKVVLTRKEDEYITLEDRCQIANSMLAPHENGLFVSIHLNIWINPKSRGFEVYYLSHDEEINQERVYTHMEDIRALPQDYFKKIFSYLEVVQYQRESYFLANQVTSLMTEQVKDYPIRDYSKSEIFYVLRGVLMPSILVEVGFISNRKDMEQINDRDKRGKILSIISEAVVNYVDEFKKTDGFREGIFLEKSLSDN